MRLGFPAGVHSGEGRGGHRDARAQLEAGVSVGGAVREGELLMRTMLKGEACWVSSARPERMLGSVLAQGQSLRPGLKPCRHLPVAA